MFYWILHIRFIIIWHSMFRTFNDWKKNRYTSKNVALSSSLTFRNCFLLESNTLAASCTASLCTVSKSFGCKQSISFPCTACKYDLYFSVPSLTAFATLFSFITKNSGRRISKSWEYNSKNLSVLLFDYLSKRKYWLVLLFIFAYEIILKRYIIYPSIK